MIHCVTRTLGEICDDAGGIIRTGPFGTQLHQSDYSKEGTPVIMPQNIVDGKVSGEGIARIRDEDVNRLLNHRLQVGDIVYGRRGDIGRRALITKNEEGWLCGTGSLRISLGGTVIDPKFLYYYLGQSRVINLIYNNAIGATLPNLNTSIIRRIPITYPTMPDQCKIVSILSAYDDLIENNQRRIKILDDMAQMLYREWFVNFRFPGHEKIKTVDSELRMIPEGWEIKKIEEFVLIKSGFPFKSDTYEENGTYGIVTIKNVNDGIFDVDCTNRTNIVPSKLPNYCNLEDGDILISLTGNIGRVCFVYGNNLLLNQRVGKLILKNLKDKAFLYVMFRQTEMQERFKTIANGVAQQNLSPVETGRLKILIPSADLLNQYMEFSDPIFKQILVFLKQNINLRNTRDMLLPKLISGEIDVSDLDIKVEEDA